MKLLSVSVVPSVLTDMTAAYRCQRRLHQTFLGAGDQIVHGARGISKGASRTLCFFVTGRKPGKSLRIKSELATAISLQKGRDGFGRVQAGRRQRHEVCWWCCHSCTGIVIGVLGIGKYLLRAIQVFFTFLCWYLEARRKSSSSGCFLFFVYVFPHYP